jgi:hypothetical protein
MKTTARCEYRHPTDPLFRHAVAFYNAIQALDCERGARSLRAMIERAAIRLTVCLTEAADLSDVRVRRLSDARACAVKLHGLLILLRQGGFIDERAHDRVHSLLHVLADKLERLKEPDLTLDQTASKTNGADLADFVITDELGDKRPSVMASVTPHQSPPAELDVPTDGVAEGLPAG